MFEFESSKDFRLRLALSLISGQPIKIAKIRSKSESGGLQLYEASYLQLLDAVSNGSVIKINDTGTQVIFQPGTLMGGQFDVNVDPLRGVGYYLEPLLLLAPFCKNPLDVRLTGVTNNSVDPSPELISMGWLPVLSRFLGPAGEARLKLTVNRRGAHPKGGGEVSLMAAPVRALRPVQFKAPGKIYKIRGMAWTARVSPQMSKRMIVAAKTILNQFLSDVYITADHYKGESGGLSPGFGITLIAETKHGARYTAECISQPEGSSQPPSLPEDLGIRAANLLCDQIYKGGCVDHGAQSITLAMMALVGGKDVSQLLTGPLTDYAISTLRLLKQFFNVTMDLKPERVGDKDEERTRGGGGLMCSCFGTGITNINKPVR